MTDHEKRYNFTSRQKNLVNVLHRPVEIAVDSSYWQLHEANFRFAPPKQPFKGRTDSTWLEYSRWARR